jgi:hypothetical protein
MNTRGRPRKCASDRKENRIDLRLNDFWLSELMEFAKQHDLPPATAARVLLVGCLQDAKDQGLLTA